MKFLRQWRILTVLILVFAAGTVTGGVAHHVMVKRAAARSMKMEYWKSQVLADLDRKLQLTPDQHGRIAVILNQGGDRISSVFSNTLHNSGDVIVDIQRLVDQQLTQEQKVRHAAMKKAFREELKRSLNYDLPSE